MLRNLRQPFSIDVVVVVALPRPEISPPPPNPHSYISRVTNSIVLEQAGAAPLSNTLLNRQLLLLGHIAQKPADDPVRCLVLRPLSCQLIAHNFKRKRGRPRKTWIEAVFAHAVRAAGGEEALPQLWQDSVISAAAWRATVKRYCDAL